ncbi:hypothetical protein HDV00_003475 [Rhizophlyctis rosea]|nr:hypothetical protein HDV00_003475 [Rhizophlyctis rosea]
MSSTLTCPFAPTPLDVPELFYEVLSRLRYRDVKRIRRVCSAWRTVCDKATLGKEIVLTLRKVGARSPYDDECIHVPMYLRQRVCLDTESSQTVLEFIPAVHREFPRPLTIPTTVTFSTPNADPKTVVHPITKPTPVCLPTVQTHPSQPPMAEPFGLGQTPDGINYYVANHSHPVYQLEHLIRFGKPFREGISAIFSPFFTLRFGSNRPLTHWYDNTTVMSLTLPIDWVITNPQQPTSQTPRTTVYSHTRKRLLTQVYARHKPVFHREYNTDTDYFDHDITHDFLSRPHPQHWPLIPRLLSPQTGAASLQHFAIELQRLMDRTKIVEAMSELGKRKQEWLVRKYRAKTLEMWGAVVGWEVILQLSGFESEDEGKLFAFLVRMTKSQSGGWVV